MYVCGLVFNHFEVLRFTILKDDFTDVETWVEVMHGDGDLPRVEVMVLLYHDAVGGEELHGANIKFAIGDGKLRGAGVWEDL